MASEESEALDKALSGVLRPPAPSGQLRARILGRIAAEKQAGKLPIWPEVLDFIGWVGVSLAAGFFLHYLFQLPAFVEAVKRLDSVPPYAVAGCSVLIGLLVWLLGVERQVPVE